MKFAILGAGGMAREIHGLLMDNGVSPEAVEFFVDVAFVSEANNHLDIEGLRKADPNIVAIPAAGSSALRQKWYESLSNQIDFNVVIHHLALLGPRITLGKGSIVTAHCHMTCDIVVGLCGQFNFQTTVSHDVTIGDYCTAGPNVNICGNVQIGHRVTIGASGTIAPGVSICDDVTIGAGAVVVKDITEPGTYVGVPAKKLEPK